MLLLPDKSRRFIDFAIKRLPDGDRKRNWLAWSQTHPKVRVYGDPEDDGSPPIPSYVVDAALFALERMDADIRDRRLSLSSSEDASERDRDLAYIRSIREALKKERVTA